ncbi:hypothetical protein PHET_09666 [Paragonimus heterotremus]|uniref:Uncharacterized protein n=1 Tax=Paragonimus heterotremus TaxID=100268 RepID=A0A8J4WCQ2_9TREM|nr:hypothetical protein PHET_09666 [Paragonimus heterotremus]
MPVDGVSCGIIICCLTTIISLPSSVLSYPVTSVPIQNNSADFLEILTTSLANNTSLYTLQTELSTVLRSDHDQLLTNESFLRQVCLSFRLTRSRNDHQFLPRV